MVQTQGTPVSRFLHTSLEKDKRLFMFGGFHIDEDNEVWGNDSKISKNKKELNDLWMYSYDTKSWKEILTSKSIQQSIGYLSFEKDNLVIFGSGKKSKGKEIIENVLDSKTRKNLKLSSNPFPFKFISNRNQVPLLSHFEEKGITIFSIGGTNFNELVKFLDLLETRYQLRKKANPFGKFDKEFNKIASYMNSKEFLSFYKVSKNTKEKLSNIQIHKNEFNFHKLKSFIKKGLFNQDHFPHQPLPFISNLNLKNVSEKIKNADLKKFELLLKIIHAENCEKLTDEAFISFPELEEIFISHAKITNNFFEKKNNLKKVFFEDCNKITIQPLVKLQQKGIKDIYIKNCSGVNSKQFEKEFKTKMKDISLTIVGPKQSGKSVLLTHFEALTDIIKMDDAWRLELFVQNIISVTNVTLLIADENKIKFEHPKSSILKEKINSKQSFLECYKEFYPNILGFWKNEKTLLKLIEKYSEVHDGFFYQVNRLHDYSPDRLVLNLQDYVYVKQQRSFFAQDIEYLNFRFRIQFVPVKKFNIKLMIQSKYIIYVLSLTHYSINPNNQERLRDLKSSYEEFKEFSKKNEKNQILLILNKKDLFESRIEKYNDFNNYFPDFEKSNCKTPTEYLSKLFSNISSNITVLTLNLVDPKDFLKVLDYFQENEK